MGKTQTSNVSLVAEGKKAPAFHLADQHGGKHRLSDYLGQWVVLYFYPKDNTSGCTKQACQFREASAQLRKRGAVILGVSPDNEQSHAKFADNHDLAFPLLADHDAKICSKYGVWQRKSMYGRSYMGVVRTTYLIDPLGKISRRFDKVKVPGHEKQVLDALKDLCE